MRWTFSLSNSIFSEDAVWVVLESSKGFTPQLPREPEIFVSAGMRDRMNCHETCGLREVFPILDRMESLARAVARKSEPAVVNVMDIPVLFATSFAYASFRSYAARLKVRHDCGTVSKPIGCTFSFLDLRDKRTRVRMILSVSFSFPQQQASVRPFYEGVSVMPHVEQYLPLRSS